jgi:hypothetical protein
MNARTKLLLIRTLVTFDGYSPAGKREALAGLAYKVKQHGDTKLASDYITATRIFLRMYKNKSV